MVKKECVLPFIVMMIIFIFVVYDIYSILKREPFKVISDCPILSLDTDYGITVLNTTDDRSMHLLLNPGLFPHYTFEKGEEIPINGGLPQKGNLSLHLEEFEKSVKFHILENHTGWINIQMSYWRAKWDSNSDDNYKIYQEKSKDLIGVLNEHWRKLDMIEQINQMAQDTFEKSAKHFLTSTIKRGKALRPAAKWGLSGSPVCSNCISCERENKSGFDWLFSTSDVAFPLLEVHQSNKVLDGITKCIEENSKIKAKYMIKIFLNTSLTYYNSDKPIKKEHLREIFTKAKNAGLDGIIVWTNSFVEDSTPCNEFSKNLKTGFLGDLIKEIAFDWSI